MPENIAYDRLCGVKSLQNFSGIYADFQIPTNIVTTAPSDSTGASNPDFAAFYLIFNSYVEGGISWKKSNATGGLNGLHFFLNTYGGDGPYPYWQSVPVENYHSSGLYIGLGSTITLRLEVNGARSQLYCNGVLIFDQPNFTTQPSSAIVGYTHGVQDQIGWDQHNTATWSNIHVLNNNSWVTWDAATWGYANDRKHEDIWK
jgi:hypothetical protein